MMFFIILVLSKLSVPHSPRHYSHFLLSQILTEYCANCDTQKNIFIIIFSAIAITHDSLFKEDQNILVLPLDSLKFDTHEKLTQDVLKHFGKVVLFCE